MANKVFMANKTNLRDQRLRSLTTILLWEGELSNKRIRDLFGLQNVQASRLTAEFRAAYPDMIKDDESRRVMLINRDGAQKSHIEDYVRLLYEIEDKPEAIEDVRTDLAPIDPAVFAVIRHACLNHTGADIRYASMTHPEGTQRTIFPNTIVRAGRRWHTRAWCGLRNEYRDFAFGRIRQADISTAKPGNLDPDTQWETIIDVRLAAHRGLDDKQARVVRDEYFDGAIEKNIQSRICLTPYLLQDIRASVDPEKQAPPEYQIEVANIENIRKYLWD